MLLANLHDDENPDQQTLLIGLSRENINRLFKDQPIQFEFDMVVRHEGAKADVEMPPLKILVCAGETEDAIREQLEKATGMELKPNAKAPEIRSVPEVRMRPYLM
jgi:hypothetical protein